MREDLDAALGIIGAFLAIIGTGAAIAIVAGLIHLRGDKARRDHE